MSGEMVSLKKTGEKTVMALKNEIRFNPSFEK